MGKKSDKQKGEPEKAKKIEKKIEKKVVKKPVKKVEVVVPPTPVAPVVEKPKAKVVAKPVAAKPVIEKPVVKAKAPAKPKAKKSAPTFEEIQLQAYFVAEKRIAAGLPGDSASDWVQAEKELLAAQ